MENTKFTLGDIVALISHPFHEGNFNIAISGEPMQQSPLMVITQILISKDENPLNCQYKCMWFSQKNQRFEEVWILVSLLKLIQKAENFIDHIPAIGTQLLFRTSQLEMQKRKSSFSSESTDVEKNLTNITPLLSFVSPVLLVIGSKNDDIKDTPPLSGRLEKGSTYIKVKWFNMVSDKMSESFIPVFALANIPAIDITNLNSFQEAIKSSHFLKVKIGDDITFLKPIGLNYLAGSYFLRAGDFIKGKTVNNLNIGEIEILEVVDTPVKEKGPVFDFSKRKKPITTTLDILKKAVSTDEIVRIKYVSQHGTVTKRCIRNFTISKGYEDEKETFYLTGFCLSKMDIRHFNISRINWVEIINLEASEIL